MGRFISIYIEQPTTEPTGWAVPDQLLLGHYPRQTPRVALSFPRSAPLTEILFGPDSPFSITEGVPNDLSSHLAALLESFSGWPYSSVWTIPIDELALFEWRRFTIICVQSVQAGFAQFFENGELTRDELERRFLGTSSEHLLNAWFHGPVKAPIDWTSASKPALPEHTRPAIHELRFLEPHYIVPVTWIAPLSFLLDNSTLEALDSFQRYPHGARAILIVDGNRPR